jgi:hypothetical protein
MVRLTWGRVGAAGSVFSNSGIERATAIAAWLSVHRAAIGHGEMATSGTAIVRGWGHDVSSLR